MSARILVHGGAGTLFPERVSTERENAARAGLAAALQAGSAYLPHSALDAVEAAVKVLEDCEVFNAGRGSVYTHTGQQEMDAAIMCGHSLQAGAVAGVQGIRYPIALARQVLEHSSHVLLIGAGAEAFAQTRGCERQAADFFHSDYRWQQLLQIRDKQQTALDHDLGSGQSYGTVGAVALDAQGQLAAATSTGGMTNKRFGRVGDSALIGAGTYADKRSCAVSATGHGEYFIRAVVAYDLACRMRYGQSELAAAAEASLEAVAALGGAGGLIAIDAQGNWCMPFVTGRMYRGTQTLTTAGEVWIY